MRNLTVKYRYLMVCMFAATVCGSAKSQEYLSIDTIGIPDLGRLRLLEEVTDFPIEVILRDIQKYGYSSRNVPISQERATKQEVDLIISTLKAPMLAGGSVALRRTDSSLRVTIGLPEMVTILQASEGACTSASGKSNWPFNIDDVRERLTFNRAVLKAANIPFDRSEVMVLDSGLGEGLAGVDEFRRMLWVNRTEALAGGSFYRNSALEKACSDPDGESHVVRHGFLPQLGYDGQCHADSPWSAITPPLPTKPVSNYEPAHGSFVAGLAVGGPELSKQMPDLNEYVTVAIARNARAQTDNDGVVSVASDIIDVMDGVDYAERFEIDVLNLSLSIPPDVTSNAGDWIKPLRQFETGGGLIVVAAGNGGFEIGSVLGPQSPLPDTASLPLAVAGKNGVDSAIIVGGTQLSSTGAIESYTGTNWSADLVDIGAPAVGVMSYNLDGSLACLPGTSVSAPQVSFVAAALFAMGFWSADEVKRRILATADVVPDLFSRVRDGRSLNVKHALDPFVDLLWLKSNQDEASNGEVLRVLLLDENQLPGGQMIKVCNTPTGWVDSRRLIMWQRITERDAKVWAEMDHLNHEITAVDNICPAGTSQLSFIDLETGQIRSDLSLDDVERVVPSRFRIKNFALRVAQEEYARPQ